MSGIKKVVTMSAFILLIMAVLIGCPMLLKDNTVESGQYIELNIGGAAAKAITVTEYDVTKLEIEIYDPQGAFIEDFSWYPDEGQQSYLIPVTGEGEYEIVVTHISDDNGTVIEAVESAVFNIEVMVITAINIIPGLIGYIDITPGNDDPQEPIDLTGYWDFYWTPEGVPEIGPILFYIHQTGSILECTQGFSGTISGSDITLEAWIEMDEPSGLFHVMMTGSVSGGEIAGLVSGDLGEGMFRFVDTTMPFGRLDLEGNIEALPISLHTDYGLGIAGTNEMGDGSFELFFEDHELEVYLWFNLSGPLNVGEYLLPMDAWFSIRWLQDGMGYDDYYLDTAGTLTITYIDNLRIAGSFVSYTPFELTGSFDVGLIEQQF